MDKSTDLESKYQKLAAEYSKVRSHAVVLKKAVLDEQSKIFELKEQVKEQEQKIRKHDQEMESLTFRNDQLTKRITVLQKELQVNNHHGKKSKSKGPDMSMQSNLSVLDEELHKKIVENAQLVSLMADKDLEIANSKEKLEWLETRVSNLQKKIDDMEGQHKDEVNKIKLDYLEKLSNKSLDIGLNPVMKEDNKKDEAKTSEQEKISKSQIEHWKQEADRWKKECEILHAKPDTNEALTDYYESQIMNLLTTKQHCVSETNTLWAENLGLQQRLENLILEKGALESILNRSNEELHTTKENYKQQLDAMTEHVATQNEKITKLSDEVEFYKHQLGLKK